MERLYWDAIKINDKSSYFTVTADGINFMGDVGAGVSQVYDFYPHREFEFRNDRSITQRYVDQFEDFLIGDRTKFELPINLADAGSEADQRVWDAVVKLQYGTISTVDDLANTTHLTPEAVLQALRKTPVPILIPVHRILDADGNSVARGGSSLNAQLVQMETLNGLDDFE